MRRMFMIALMLSLLIGASEAGAAIYYWAAPVSGSWGVDTLWSPPQVPGTMDTARIWVSGTYTVTVNADDSVGCVQIAGASGTQTLSIPSQILTVVSSAEISTNGVLSLSGGRLRGNGWLNVSGTINWSGGYLTGASNVTISSAGSIVISGTSTKYLQARTVNNDGLISCSGTGAFYLSDGATIHNLANGEFTVASDLTIGHGGGAATPFNNTGIVRKSAGSGTTTFSSVPFNNTGGTVEVQTGTISLNAGGTSTGGTLTCASGAALVLGGGTHVWSGTYNGSGAGVVRFSSGTLEIPVAGATLALTNGGFEWTYVTITGAGTLQNDGLFNIVGTGTKYLNGVAVSNNGTVNWSGSGFVYASNGSVFTNEAGGQFLSQSDHTYGYNGGAVPSFNNAGTVRKTAGTGTTTFNAITFNNTGVVEAESGKIALSGGGTSTGNFDAVSGSAVEFTGGTHALSAGAAFTGLGPGRVVSPGIVTVNAPVTAETFEVTNGTLNGPDTLTITGTGTWSGGYMSGTGVTFIPMGATLNITGTSTRYLDTRTLHNEGIVNWSATGSLYGLNGSIFDNTSSGEFIIQANSSYNYNGGAIPSFNNAGTVRKSAGTGITTFSSNVLFNNTGGTVEVQTGTISLNGGGTSTGGTLNCSAGTALVLAAGTHVWSGTHSGSGDGVVRFSGNTLEPHGATLALSGGGFQWTGGIISGPGELHNDGVFNIVGSGTKQMVGQHITNSGAVNWSGAGNIYPSSGSVFTNEVGGQFFSLDNHSFQHNGGTGTIFNNEGTVCKSGGTGTTLFNAVAFNNDGLVQIQTGKIALSGGGTSTGNFDAVSGSAVEFTGGTHNLNTGTNFTGSGPGRIVSGTVSVNALVTAETFEITSGTLGGPDTLAITGTGTWSGGYMSGTGVTLIAVGSTFNIAGTATRYLDTRTVRNEGMVNWSASGTLYGQNGAVFDNASGGQFVSQTNHLYSHGGGDVSAFNNMGTVRQSAGTGVTTFSGVPFNNIGGTVEVEAGTMSLSGGGTSTGGTLTCASGAALVLGGGTHVWSGTYSGSGDGVVRLSAGSLQIPVAGAILALANGGFEWTAVTITGSGTLQNDGVFNIAGTGTKYLDGVDVSNNGTVNWSGTGTVYAQNGVVFTNEVGGQFLSLNNHLFHHNIGATTIFNNEGTVRKSSGTGSTSFGLLTFSNMGTLGVEIGTIRFNGGSLTNAVGAVIEGWGMLDVSGTTFTNSGETHPGISPGILTITGDYPQGETSALEIDVQGLNVGTEYDRLAISGTATLGGTLRIIDDLYTPSGSAEFTILTCGSRVDTFDQVDGLSINDSLCYTLEYTPTSVVLHLMLANAPEQLVMGQIETGWSLFWDEVPFAEMYNVYQVHDDGSTTFLGQTTEREYDITALVNEPESRRFFMVTAAVSEEMIRSIRPR